MNRFDEDQRVLDDFANEFLVCCPKCNEKAYVSLTYEDYLSAQIICNKCGYAKKWQNTEPKLKTWSQNSSLYQKGVISIGAPVDWCFHLPLWLKTSCCGHELWAYNDKHLDWLEGYVAAKHRQRRNDQEIGWRNRSLASRLPKWIKASKNRDAILKAISKLRNKSLPHLN